MLKSSTILRGCLLLIAILSAPACANKKGVKSLIAAVATPSPLVSGKAYISMTSFPTIARGGMTLDLVLDTKLGDTTVKSQLIEFSSDGFIFTPVALLPSLNTHFTWVVPLIDTSYGLLKYTVTDINGNSSFTLSNNFKIKSTLPAPPVVTLSSSTPTNAQITRLTVSDCTGRSSLLVNESTKPSLVSSGWTPCLTTAGGMSYSLLNTQGSHDVHVWAQDAAGNISALPSSITVIYDSILPQIAIGAVPNTISATTAVTLNWTITEASISNASNFIIEAQSTASGAWTQVGSVPGSLGPLTNAPFSFVWTIPSWVTNDASVRIKLTDLAGNIGSAQSSSFIVKDGYPLISFNPFPTTLKGGATQILGFTASSISGTISNVSLQYAPDGSTFTNLQTWTASVTPYSSSYTWTVPSSNLATAKLRLIATNSLLNVSTAMSSAFTIDSTPPVLSAGQFVINGGAASTSNNIVSVALKATDNLTNINYICLKLNTTAPLITDNCWRSVSAAQLNLTPGLSLVVPSANFNMGLTPGVYTIYGWARDAAGNISVLSNSGAGTAGVDQSSITYTVPTPPQITNVGASIRDAFGNPFDKILDLSAPLNKPVVVKWKASSASSLSSSAISVSFTVDGINYVSLESGVSNSAGAGCTVDGTNYTGCTVVNSPTSGSYSIRVTVTDPQNQTASASAVPLNLSPLNIIAGNTDPGFGGSANSAIILSKILAPLSVQPNALAVSSTGKFFILEQRGLIAIDPADKLYKTFIPITGVTTDGLVSTATLKAPTQIAMDSQDRLLIYDSDRIRRVDLDTNVVSTFIGGGTDTTDGTDALNFAVSAPNVSSAGAPLFTALPNGDLWFQMSGEYLVSTPQTKIRIYKSSLNKVYSLTPSGIGSLEDPNFNASTRPTYNIGIRYDNTSTVTQIRARAIVPVSGGQLCYSMSYDPVTGVSKAPYIPYVSYWGEDQTINGRTSGEMYSVEHQTKVGIYRYDLPTNNWVRIVGTGSLGQCNDGTAALLCDVDPEGLYVGNQDQLYFLDRGRIRTVDGSGKVVTIFGQSRAFGDGGKPESARFNKITWIDRINDGRIVIKDDPEAKFREFSVGGSVSTIAGTGKFETPDTTTLAVNQGVQTQYWGGTPPFSTNPATGDILYSRDFTLISALDRSTGKWRDIAGTGSTNDLNADGLTGNQISFSGNYPTGPIGFNGISLMRHRFTWDGTQSIDGFFRLFTFSTGTQSTFAGSTGPLADLNSCTDGSSLTSCRLPSNFGVMSKFNWDATNSRWLFVQVNDHSIRAGAQGGTISTFYSAPYNMTSFVYVTKNTNHYIYYCANNNYHLRKYSIESASDVEVTWPNATITCTGDSMAWDPVRKTVIFPIIQNNLAGIAEFNDP